MRLLFLELLHVALPLKKAIKHASHERRSSDSFVVRASLEGGHVGHGEGVPRDYVTGETIATCFQAVPTSDVASHLGRPSRFEEVVERLDSWTLPSIASDPRGMFGNAARCAVELAILDAYGRAFGRPLSDAIRPSPHTEPRPRRVRYSGAITAEGKRKEIISAWKMRIYGFHQVKVKVGVPGQDDPARLERFRRILGRRADIRIDANEAWTDDVVIDRVRPLLPFRPSALEQPLPHEQVGRLASLRPRLGVPVMLDESLCGEPDARDAIDRGLADILNVRLSKCGGLLPSLRIIDLTYRAGLGVQLGCHPGESAILSAAGRALASRIRGLRSVEGSYDRHVLASNVSQQDITFGYGGRAAPLTGPGLGVDVDPSLLEPLVQAREVISYE